MMDIKKLNIKEILQMAIVMEEQGVQFYKLASDNAKDQESKKVLHDLSKMEEGHKSKFANLLEELNDHDVLTNYINETVSLYIQSITANPYLDEVHEIKSFIKNNSFDKVLSYCVQTEKDAVTFYSEIKNILEEKSAIQVVDAIIDEEKTHVVLIEKLRKSLDK